MFLNHTFVGILLAIVKQPSDSVLTWQETMFPCTFTYQVLRKVSCESCYFIPFLCWYRTYNSCLQFCEQSLLLLKGRWGAPLVTGWSPSFIEHQKQKLRKGCRLWIWRRTDMLFLCSTLTILWLWSPECRSVPDSCHCSSWAVCVLHTFE